MKLVRSVSALLLILVASCATGSRQPAPATLVPGTGWRLTALDGVAIDPRTAPTLAFPNAGGVHGDGGCNRYSAIAKLDDDEIELGDIATTRRACPDEVMARERRFLEVLGAAERLELVGGFLFVHSAEAETPLRFEPDPRHPAVLPAGLRFPDPPNDP